MTNPSEVKISDAQLSALCEALHILDPEPGTDWHKRCKQILSEWIARRVPDAMPYDKWSDRLEAYADNDCRARVLNGPE